MSWKRLTSLLGIEDFLDLRQQVGSNARAIGHEVWDVARQPIVLQHTLGGGPFGRIGVKTMHNEILGSLGDILPILIRFKLVIAGNDGLRFLGLRVPVERGVTAEEEIGNDAHSPDVDRFVIASCQCLVNHPASRRLLGSLTFLEDLRRRVLGLIRG